MKSIGGGCDNDIKRYLLDKQTMEIPEASKTEKKKYAGRKNKYPKGIGHF